MCLTKPGLFGINKSNRDFTKSESWGKNQFNSSFPASLVCYFQDKNLNMNYIWLDKDMNIVHKELSPQELFKINPMGADTFYSFETAYLPYQKYYIGSIPRNDLTILNNLNMCVSSFEIKLTALPDNQTCNLTDEGYGTELVIRPDTVIYQAFCFIESMKNSTNKLKEIIGYEFDEIKNWSEIKEVLPYLKGIKEKIMRIVSEFNENQMPLILQPIWKTDGKNPTLCDNCLDIFVWSNFSLLKLYLPDNPETLTTINRPTRTMVWLFKMLYDYSKNGAFDGKRIIDEITFNTKNDKAFSIGGKGTHPYMKSPYLHSPRIQKKELKRIILGGGQNLLSPERRFDAIIYNSPDLFIED